MNKFTEIYITMVTKADEIQRLCKYNKGDWFWNGEKPYLYTKSGLGSSNPHDYKWLPTLWDLLKITDTASWNIPEILYTLSKRNIGLDKLLEELLELIMEFWHEKKWNKINKVWEEINGS